MSAKREAVTTGSVIYPDPAKSILLTGAAGSLEQSRSGTLSANEAARVRLLRGACLWQVPVHRRTMAMTWSGDTKPPGTGTLVSGLHSLSLAVVGKPSQMPLIRLIYTSLRQSRSPREMIEILEQSEARNAVDAITGALVMTPDFYVQVLEGERKVVNACYDRIRRDPRHSDVELILLELIEERWFPDWSMTAVDLSEDHAIAPYTEGKEFRPGDLPRAVVERLFRDVAARLRRS